MKTYPQIEVKNPCEYHYRQEKKLVPSLAFDTGRDFAGQQARIGEKLKELLKLPAKQTQPVPIIVDEDTSDPRFDEKRFLVETEPEFYIPAHLLLPKNWESRWKKEQIGLPVVICLQGHTAGMHVSMAREPYPGKMGIECSADRDFALQAIGQGYAALVMEQRGFGELAPMGKGVTCHHLAWQAAMMGKSLLGERVHDISCMIDAVEAGFPFIDRKKIGVTGNSGGGTSAFYAACLDERIKVSMPASCFCKLADSWGNTHHCDCSYIHGILQYMDMPDMAALIAPRPLILINGISDPINPIEATREAFEMVKKIYHASGAEENCRLLEGPEGHRYYADLAWPVFREYI